VYVYVRKWNMLKTSFLSNHIVGDLMNELFLKSENCEQICLKCIFNMLL